MSAQTVREGVVAVPELFHALFEDAAIFPPGNAALGRAVAAHLSRRHTDDGRFVGPFLCSGARLPELTAALPEDTRDFGVAVIEPDAEAVPGRLAETGRDSRLVPRAVEVVAGPDGPERTVRTLDRALPQHVLGYVELPFGHRLAEDMGFLAGGRHRAKFRTGGTHAAAFPGEADLADAVVACVRAGVAFKLTAGLHRAVRHRDPATGFEHHGVLNVAAAVAVAAEGGNRADVTQVLAQTEHDRLLRTVGTLDAGGLQRVRRSFAGLGTCSISEPLGDLRALGLIVAATR